MENTHQAVDESSTTEQPPVFFGTRASFARRIIAFYTEDPSRS